MRKGQALVSLRESRQAACARSRRYYARHKANPYGGVRKSASRTSALNVLPNLSSYGRCQGVCGVKEDQQLWNGLCSIEQALSGRDGVDPEKSAKSTASINKRSNQWCSLSYQTGRGAKVVD